MSIHFQKNLKDELDRYLAEQETWFPRKDIIKIDLHCHDYNSDVPDELIGRILRVPETWLPSERLLKELKKNGCDAFTITNHNNARSCYVQQDKGVDVLTAAEFSCLVPDFEIGIHVLAYGFTPEQETKLNNLRKNVYEFQAFARKHNIPTIWAHPLYHYAVKKMPPMDFFNKVALIFERFEMLNGQRDTWQNMLVKEWIGRITPETIYRHAKEFDIDPLVYCVCPYRKVLTGGSDSHTGIFAGMTGSYLYLSDLQSRLKTTPKSDLVLEALRKGHVVPFGAHQNTEKLTISFLNYVSQIALNYKDPGLVRLLLHKGGMPIKIVSFIASNIFSEVQRHKVTMTFIKLFYNCMMGEKPSFLKKLLLPSHYQPIFDDAVRLAEVDNVSTLNRGDKVNNDVTRNRVDEYYNSILSINNRLNDLLASRLNKKVAGLQLEKKIGEQSLDSFISNLELPIGIRAYLDHDDHNAPFDVSDFLDGLSFPFLTSLFILAAHFTSAKTMFHTRPFLRRFSKDLGKFEQPKRILWLTDTFGDKNGVSMFLQEMHKQIKARNLPVDILTCSDKIQPDDHLHVLKPLSTFEIPIYTEQTINIPNFTELHNLFLKGEYDRLICSTEGVMGLCGLYLKHAYTVEASFYMHTDWLMFVEKVLNITGQNLDRVRRFLRFFYKSFDRLFVLNSDQKRWLTGQDMNFNPKNVYQTSHWVNTRFTQQKSDKKRLFGFEENTPVLLFVGRLSQEKGVPELSDVYRQVKNTLPETRMVIVGKGPALNRLKEDIPDGVFIDWIEQSELPVIYSSADLLLLPSRFDTFCNAVLEALSCGLPVIAYNDKGPKDIILNYKCGYLVQSAQEMVSKAIYYLQSDLQESFRLAAVERAKCFDAEIIVSELLENMGIRN